MGAHDTFRSHGGMAGVERMSPMSNGVKGEIIFATVYLGFWAIGVTSIVMIVEFLGV